MRTLASFAASFAVELAASTLAPPRCAACDARVPLLTALCPPCAATAERDDWARSGAAYLYGGAVARSIVRMKYEKRPDLGRPLGHLLWRSIEPHSPSLVPRGLAARSAVVVPVPLHPSRLAERGFNQSSLLAGHVARGLRASFWPLALARARDTPPQTALDRAARAANVAGAFFVRNPDAVRGRHFVLVDDVQTTGATLHACARALLGAGAARVVSATVARAPPPG